MLGLLLPRPVARATLTVKDGPPMRILPLLLLTGCLTAHVGVESHLNEERPVEPTVEVRGAIENGAQLLDATLRTRASTQGAEVGLSADYCMRPQRLWIQPQLCGRVFPIEVGSRNGDFVLGTGSVAVGPGLWVPLRAGGPGTLDTTSTAGVQGLQVQLWGGLDVRPLEDRKTAPYVGLTLGYGQGSSKYFEER